MNRKNRNKGAVSAEPRRIQILDAALACFAEKGFHQTSVRDIASAAGISLGNVYNHFSGKDALVFEIAEQEALEIGNLEQILTGASTPEIAIELFVDWYFRQVTEPFYAAIAIEVASESMRNKAVAKVILTNRKKMVKILKVVLTQGMQQGLFDQNLDAGEAANLMIDAIEGAGVRYAMEGKRGSRYMCRQLKNHIMKVVQ